MLKSIGLIISSISSLLFGITEQPAKVPKIKPSQSIQISIPCTGKAKKLVDAALERTTHSVRYDGRYVSLKYPGGDVPDNIGVCTDVVIRSFRKLDIDLQKDVHEDMKLNFSKYPNKWGLKRTDTNIDHRRVPNLRTFFQRHGQTLKISNIGLTYKPGELVTWMLPGNLPHIGIVSNQLSNDRKRPLTIHNIGSGPVAEDVLFSFKITGRYTYWGR